MSPPARGPLPPPAPTVPEKSSQDFKKAHAVCGALFAPRQLYPTREAAEKWCRGEWERLRTEWGNLYQKETISWAVANVEIGELPDSMPHIQFALATSSSSKPRSWWQRLIHPDIK